MKKRILILLLLLALVLSACSNQQVLITDTYNGVDYTLHTLDQTITLDGTTCHYRIDSRGSEKEYTITYPDGAVYTSTGGGNALYNEADRPNARSIIEILRVQNQGGISLLPVICGLAFFALGVLSLINPRLMWRLRYSWRRRNTEPSNLSLVFIRLSGLLLLVPGLIFLLM